MGGHASQYLSIIVCAYNEAKTICSKIEDILLKDKNGEVLEVIVVDDYSSEETFKIAHECSKNSKKLTVLKNVYKKGKWGAIITGFKYARGEIICITDADVTFEKDTLGKALKLFDDPLVGGVTSNQRDVLIGDGKESMPSVSFYERFRNFFRIIESKIDSTIAFHGQCMFFRKNCVELTEGGSAADDLDIAVRIRRNGHRTVFCNDSYYIEKRPGLFNEISKRIFRRRARAVVHTIMKNRDILFNFRYRKFGFICFPIEFFINIVAPFLIVAVPGIAFISILLFPVKYKFLSVVFIFLLFSKHQLLKMAWYQMVSVISYLLNPKSNCIRWSTPRY